MNADIGLFFGGAPEALALYAALERALLAACPGARIKVQKTQITFAARYGFAFVSLPRRRGEAGILVSFGLPTRLASPRVVHAAEPYPNRWTHHVLVARPSEVDAELLGWLGAAYAFSMTK